MSINTIPIESQQFACWSEVDALKKVAIFKPASINISNESDKKYYCFKDCVSSEELMKNYESLRNALLKYDVEVHDLFDIANDEERKILESHPNRIFVRDIAAVVGTALVLGNTGIESRQQEFTIGQNILQRISPFVSFKPGLASLAEFGDLLIIDADTLLISCGDRTNYSFKKDLVKIAWSEGFNEVAVIRIPNDFKKIHLDLVCNIVTNKIFCAFEGLKDLFVTSYKSNEKVGESDWLEPYFAKKGLEIIWLEEKHFDSFMSNYLVVNDKTIFANMQYKDELSKKLAPYEIEIVGVDMTAYEKGGGSIRCATLPLERMGNVVLKSADKKIQLYKKGDKPMLQSLNLTSNENIKFSKQTVQQHKELSTLIISHKAIRGASSLSTFGENLKSRALNKDELSTFFATLWAFFKEVPGGIITLAARVTDDWMKHSTWEGTTVAARVLFASVDEYGLHQHHKHILPTHHELFRDLISHLGLEPSDLLDDKYIEPAGDLMGQATYRYYRTESLGEAIGFHLASEITSSREFQYFLEGFKKFTLAYKLKDEDDPVLSFFQVHCEVEPLHVLTGKDIAMSYLHRCPWMFEDMKRGAQIFLDRFDQMFIALNNTIFKEK